MQLQNGLVSMFMKKDFFITCGYVSLLFFDQSQTRETTCKQKEIAALVHHSFFFTIL